MGLDLDWKCSHCGHQGLLYTPRRRLVIENRTGEEWDLYFEIDDKIEANEYRDILIDLVCMDCDHKHPVTGYSYIHNQLEVCNNCGGTDLKIPIGFSSPELTETIVKGIMELDKISLANPSELPEDLLS